MYVIQSTKHLGLGCVLSFDYMSQAKQFRQDKGWNIMDAPIYSVCKPEDVSDWL